MEASTATGQACTCKGCLNRTGCRDARSRTMKARGIQPKRTRHGLRLNRDAFNAAMAKRNKISHRDIADYLELGTGTVSEARRGNPISDAFVSAVMKKMRGTRYRYEQLFVEYDPTEVDDEAELAAA